MVIPPEDIKYLLASSFLEDSSIGLANGKMGGCIFFFYLSRTYPAFHYRKTAEELLGQVYENISNIRSIDLKNGLSGIRSGISYLINQKYITGNPHEIFKDVDDTIFRHLCSEKYNKDLPPPILIEVLFYLYSRFLEPSNKEEEYLLRELTIHTINHSFERTTALPLFFEEPLHYNIEYKLPLFLFAIGNIVRLGFYNTRIKKILEELSPKILSTVPILHANKLYLWAAMQSINEAIKIDGWTKHIALLQRETKFDVLFHKEMKNKNIYFNTGLGSILWLLECLKNSIPEEKRRIYRTLIARQIESSDIWTIYKQPGYINQYKGLYDGITGAILTWVKVKTYQI